MMTKCHTALVNYCLIWCSSLEQYLGPIPLDTELPQPALNSVRIEDPWFLKWLLIYSAVTYRYPSPGTEPYYFAHCTNTEQNCAKEPVVE